ncbi:CHRD domain-containing protein [Cognatishimia sp.]|uniref:CHRD domain-containing protein n=1 Tax=Cognatishimia sp. TaxID=2211648 RepID=UPI0035139E22
MRFLTLFAALLPITVIAQEVEPVSGIDLRPDAGDEIGMVFEAWLSPHQEGGEEEDAPALTPSVFLSTEPSVSRNERPSRGHGTLAFTRDFSRAFAHVAIEDVDVEGIVMFHIHCGRPGMLGPILVDLGTQGDLPEMFADGVLSVEITNEDLVEAAEHGHGLVGAFTAGCPILPANPLDRVDTIAGMAHIAMEGELYFNLHTAAQTFFGDIRGQLHPVAE